MVGYFNFIMVCILETRNLRVRKVSTEIIQKMVNNLCSSHFVLRIHTYTYAPGAQIVVLECCYTVVVWWFRRSVGFSPKRNQGFLEKLLIPGLGQKLYKMSLKYFLYLIAKNLSKTTKVTAKDRLAKLYLLMKEYRSPTVLTKVIE